MIYGQDKLKGERILRGEGRAVVVRAGPLWGVEDWQNDRSQFFSSTLKRLRERECERAKEEEERGEKDEEKDKREERIIVDPKRKIYPITTDEGASTLLKLWLHSKSGTLSDDPFSSFGELGEEEERREGGESGEWAEEENEERKILQRGRNVFHITGDQTTYSKWGKEISSIFQLGDPSIDFKETKMKKETPVPMDARLISSDSSRWSLREALLFYKERGVIPEEYGGVGERKKTS